MNSRYPPSHTSLLGASTHQLEAIVHRGVRTPIACLACRRSKIKCHHSGSPPCRHCTNTGKECIIPAIINNDELERQAPLPKRRAPLNPVEGATSSFKKARYESAPNGLPVSEIIKEVLDCWFKVYYNDIFACIHQPSFRKRWHDEPDSIDPVLLLAMCTLTARFCRSVLKDFDNEQAASDYFCRRTLAMLSPNVDKASITNIQSYLMVGLHLWGASQGPSAWIYVGIAIRMAQVLDLGSEQSYAKPTSNAEWIKAEETRRTFWSAYLMDRYLSNGRGRPQTISNADITIPLPADNLNFTYGTPEATLYLGKAPAPGETLFPECTGTLASLIELVDLWSRMAKWSCARKWMTDELAPWDERSEFSKVVTLLEQWKRRLPKSLQFNDHTAMIQLSQKNANWALMWIVYNNGLLFIHRSYLKFAPARDDPKGPRDALDRGWHEPENWWRSSAETCYTAAEQIILLNNRLVDEDAQLVTPMTLFSIFSSAVMMAYLIAFPWVDPRQKVAPRSKHLFNQASSYLESVQSTWRMVGNWVETLHKMLEVHLKFAQDGNLVNSGEDHFAEYRSKVLDFGNLHTSQDPYGSSKKNAYNSSLRTSVKTRTMNSEVESLQPHNLNLSNISEAQNDTPYIQSIHEGGLIAFMQGNDWDFITDDWLRSLIPNDGSSEIYDTI